MPVSIRRIHGYQLTVATAYVDRQGWEQGMAMLGRPADWAALVK